MSTKTVSSWSELYDALYEDTYNPRIERFKSRFAYRGISTESYSLKTSLMRLGGNYASVEGHLLRQFKKYGYHVLKSDQNEWYWLSVAQHYGLPTRLLDWSYSPEVALHFATCNVNKYDTDGAVWKVNYKEAHKYLPPALRGILEEEKTSILTVELLERAYANIIELDKVGATKKDDFVVFFEPPSIDSRIFNQFAYFSISSRPNLLLDDWLNSRPDIWQKIIIPKNLKWEIRDKLDQNNISERILFPGLDGIASWLARYYLPTGTAAT